MSGSEFQFAWFDHLGRRERARMVKLWERYSEVRDGAAGGDVLLPLPVAAKLLRLTHQRLHQYVLSGELRAFRFGAGLFVVGSAVELQAQKPRRRAGKPYDRAWTPEEDALVGTDYDRVIARRLKRRPFAVMRRRWRLGVRPFRSVLQRAPH